MSDCTVTQCHVSRTGARWLAAWPRRTASGTPSSAEPSSTSSRWVSALQCCKWLIGYMLAMLWKHHLFIVCGTILGSMNVWMSSFFGFLVYMWCRIQRCWLWSKVKNKKYYFQWWSLCSTPKYSSISRYRQTKYTRINKMHVYRQNTRM